MANLITSQMASKVTLDISQAKQTFSEMSRIIRDSQNEWKAQERQWITAGDTGRATAVKMDGLNRSMEENAARIKVLKQGMQDTNVETDTGKKRYSELQAELVKAERAQASMSGQLEKTQKAWERHSFGLEQTEKNIKQVNSEIETNNRVNNANVKVLEATNRANDAATLRRDSAKKSVELQTQAIKEQKEKLDFLKQSQFSSVESINKQKVAVAESTAKLVDYQKNLTKAQISVDKMNPYGFTKMGKGMNQLYQQSDKLAKKMHSVHNSFVKVAAVTTIAGAGFGKAAKDAAELDNVFRNTYNLMITGGESAAESTEALMHMQRDAKKMSVEYGVAQEKIADGYRELIKRGYTGAQAVGSMRSMLQASVASGEDFNEVVSNSAQTLESFGMKVETTTGMVENSKEVVNKLAFAADYTATDFSGLGKAMEYVGATAYGAGITLEETSSAIGELSNRGLEADKAGTGLRKVINSLTIEIGDMGAGSSGTEAKMAKLTQKIEKQSEKLRQAQDVLSNDPKNRQKAIHAVEKQQTALRHLQEQMEDIKDMPDSGSNVLESIGIKKEQLVDANGNLKELSVIMGVINEHTKDMNTVDRNVVFNSLFGTTGQQAGLILTDSAEALGHLTKKVKESADGQGYVAELSKKNMESAKRQMDRFKESAKAVELTIGAALLPVMADAATEMAKGLNSKDGQKALEDFAQAVATSLKTLSDLVKFMVKNHDTVKRFGQVFLGLWSVKKIGDFLGYLKQVKTTMAEIQAINAATNWLGMGSLGKKTPKTPAVQPEILMPKSGKASADVTKAVSASVSTGVVDGVASGTKKGIPFLGKLATSTVKAGVGGGAVAGLLAAFSDKPMIEKTGNVLGAGIGTALGAPGGPIGAILGGVAGEMIGGLFGSAIQRGLDKKPARPKIDKESQNDAMKSIEKDYKDFVVRIDEVLKGAPELKLEGFDEKSSDKFKASTDIIIKALDDLGEATEKFYQKQSETSDNNLNKLVELGALTKEQADNIATSREKSYEKEKEAHTETREYMANETRKYNAELVRIEEGQSKELQDIAKEHGLSSKEYQEQEAKEKKAARDLYNKKMIRSEKKLGTDMSTAAKTASKRQVQILSNLAHQKGKLSKKQMQEAIANSSKEKNNIIDDAEKTYKKTKKAAEKKRDETIEAAEKEFYETGTISEKQYNEIVKNANNEYERTTSLAESRKDATIDAANTQHDEVVRTATDQAEQHIGAVDHETGSVITKTASMISGVADIYNGLIGGFNWVADKLGFGKPIPEWKYDNYVTQSERFSTSKGGKNYPQHAQGHQGILTDEIALVGEEGFELAYHPDKGMFGVGMNGPEIRPLQAGTSILPHGRSKEFLAMTAGLPAHKDGVPGIISNVADFTTDVLKGVKAKFEDISEFVSHGPEKAFDKMSDEIGLTAFTNSLNGDIPKTVIPGITGLAKKGIVSIFKPWFDAEVSMSATGKGVMSRADFDNTAHKAAGIIGEKLSDKDLNYLWRQALRESNANPDINYGYDDGDGTGQPRGLFQYKLGTFQSDMYPGHGNILSALDQFLAVMNRTGWRSAMPSQFPSGAWPSGGTGWGPVGAKKFENGGFTNRHQMIEISEGNQAEAIVPLSRMKSARGFEMLGKAAAAMASRDSLDQLTGTTSQADIDTMVNNSLSPVLSLLEKIVVNTSNPVAVQDMQQMYRNQARDFSMSQIQNLEGG